MAPLTSAIKPVLPPDSIPAALSAAATVGLVPKKPEQKVATELASKVFLNFFVSGNNPYKIPIDSKIKIIDIEKTANKNFKENKLLKSP